MPAVGRTTGFVLAVAIALAGCAVPAQAQGLPTGAHPTGVGSSAQLVVDPASWWLESGGNLTLSATWIDVPAGCALSAIWFRWTVALGTSAGTLGPTNGSSVEFHATDEGSGVASVVVGSAASLACPGNASATFARANASVTVAAPLTLSGLAVTPDPIAPNGSAVLTGTVVGGTPPYRLRVNWGGGAFSSGSIAAAGPFSIGAQFADPGTYAPVLVATDSAGDSVEAGAPEPLTVSPGFAAAIVPSTPVAEQGVPVVFTIRTANAPSSFSWQFGCEDADPASAGNVSGLAYGCSFTTPGAAPVWFEGVGTTSPFPIATAALEETVVPPPAVGFPTVPSAGEVGGAVYAPVAISGGVPPFTVTWTVVGAGRGGTLAAATDGTVLLPVASEIPGALLLAVVVTDALGVACTATEGNVSFLPSLTLAATALARTSGDAVGVNVSASAIGGSPPVDWAILPGAAAATAGPAAGVLAGAGTFDWNATYGTSGELRVTVVAVDAAGVAAVTNLTVALPSFGPGPGLGGNGGGAEAAAAIAVVVGVGGVGAVLARRRRPTSSKTPPDPVATLREVIEPSDGVDRGLVEMLAEERGVPLDLVRSTLERLKSDGTVRFGRGTDGEEVLAWSRPYEP